MAPVSHPVKHSKHIGCFFGCRDDDVCFVEEINRQVGNSSYDMLILVDEPSRNAVYANAVSAGLEVLLPYANKDELNKVFEDKFAF